MTKQPSALSERYPGELEDLREQYTAAEASRAALVDLLVDVLQGSEGEEFGPPTPWAPDVLGAKVLAVLDDERARTDVDEWDESDARCELYNLAHDLTGRP